MRVATPAARADWRHTCVALSCAASMVAAGCAAPLRQAPVASATSQPFPSSSRERAPVVGRPVVGVAFGGGSARGLAHIGVIRWFEEHRIPIDVAAGTSMGGLVGGGFAAGMDADELDRLITSLNWDDLFGSSGFAFKNIRRKADGRDYPSRLEFGLRRGIVPPASLNTGEQVERFLGRIATPYFNLSSFDELPTPFRTVAVDLITATEVVIDRGSLADAMRATMSLPLVFPPVELDGRVLVDGGAMNNVPANVVRNMGADRVIAINVGELEDRDALSFTILSVAGSTLDAMTRAATKRALASADIVINVPLESFGSLDWRRSAELIDEGYKAAEAMREQLLPLAVDDEAYGRWKEARQERRLRELPPVAFVDVEGFAPADAARLRFVLPRYVGSALDVVALERDLEPFTGLDRYQTVTWRPALNAEGKVGLVVRGRLKPYSPPFLMLGLNAENTRSTDFRITATARYLSYGVMGSGSELRVDGTLGSDPAVGAELYEPLGTSPVFFAPSASWTTSTFNIFADDEVTAQYGQSISRVGLLGGLNLGARSDVRAGFVFGRVDSDLDVGDTGLGTIEGSEASFRMMWRVDTQDTPVVPQGGTFSTVALRYQFDGPDRVQGGTSTPEAPFTQFSGAATRFWSVSGRNRLFVHGEAGTSFHGDPLLPDKFRLGSPLRLGAFEQGQLQGNHYYLATGGLLRQVGRLPDFIGAGLFAGGWIENGDAFDDFSVATWRTNVSGGVIADTLVGPILLAASAGGDGRFRVYLGVGRLFR